MDVTMAVSIVATAISLAALAVTALFTRRQILLATGANQLPVVLDAFQHTRGDAWLEAEDYVLTKLTKKDLDVCSYRDMPAPVRAHAATIGLFYDDLGILVAHGVIKQDLVVGAYGRGIVECWDALAPFAYAERRKRKSHFWVYFEDLAVRTDATSPERVYAALNLRTRPPSKEKPDEQATGSDVDPAAGST